jgi:hypothetical protein
MQVGPVDWDRFQAAMDWGKDKPAAGRSYSHVYRAEGDPSTIIIIEEWDSHASMHAYQERYGEEFNSRAGTEGLEWQDTVWVLAGSL